MYQYLKKKISALGGKHLETFCKHVIGGGGGGAAEQTDLSTIAGGTNEQQKESDEMSVDNYRQQQ